jgi:hypothetical protein
MRKLVFVLCVVGLLGFCGMAAADSIMSGDHTGDQGRYVLRMMNGRAVVNNRVPAIILDSVRGIIWTCQNLQDGKPLWVMTDLGQNGDKPMAQKKYIVKMLEWQDADLRMPAVVLDIEEGIVWNCPNVVDGKATWIQKDLKADLGIAGK